MFLLGICISNNYEYVGEWYKPEKGRGSPTPEQITEAAKNCFITGGIYIVFTVLAALCVCYQNKKAKRT
ncbi:hypothetical protein PLESTB_000024500 [Pleodorina starrii]|uniref:Uncharacterized protein n=1 Tax=Pleodorina starrii TaxID=330485 RepID=A0A9W6EX94_9CHLO|nr:hypothetical protein PLESTB_000024500 [Pleodorina starrii]